MHLLEAVFEHGTILFVEQLLIDSDLVPGGDSEKVAIERSMVDFAQCHPVGHHRIAVALAITDYVSSVEQLGMSQPAHGAV